MDLGSYQLTEKFKGLDWFVDVGMDVHGRYVVYVNRMSLDVLNQVPDNCSDKQVLCHFVSSRFGKPAVVPVRAPEIEIPVYVEEEEPSLPTIEVDLGALSTELERLEKLCSSNILQDIFYEVHDGKNAVTNLSARYPQVRTAMERLYQTYGFDVIYEEMDG